MSLRDILCGAAAGALFLTGCSPNNDGDVLLVNPERAVCVDDGKEKGFASDEVKIVDSTGKMTGYGDRPSGADAASHLLDPRADGAPSGLVFAFTQDAAGKKFCDVYTPFTPGIIKRYERVDALPAPKR